VLIHGISDKRGQHDCLYVVFSSRRKPNIPAMNAIKILLPHIDTAMGQIEPGTGHRRAPTLLNAKDNELCMHEMEILKWVKAGKTNSEVAGIMGMSAFALKNHFRNIFKKLHESL
jgi:DNA-binding NarL/FixJ family response regulator